MITRFKGGHLGGTNFDFVSLIHQYVRVDDHTAKILKPDWHEISNNKYVMDINVVLNLYVQVTTVACLLEKAWRLHLHNFTTACQGKGQ